MRLINFITLSVVAIFVFLSGCTAIQEKELRGKDVNLILSAVNIDRANAGLGLSTSYGAGAVGIVFSEPIIKGIASFFFDNNYVNFHDVDWLKDTYKKKGVFIDVNSSDLELVKNELNEFFVKNGFLFNEYNKFRGSFHKKFEDDIYQGFAVYVFPQSSGTIRLAIDKKIMDEMYKRHDIWTPFRFSSKFAMNLLNKFKKEFEENY